MFGFSFGELCVLLLVAMVVLGPKELPRYLRKAGQFAGRLRRLAYEMREKSGIDEVLRNEGIDREIAEIRRLARGEIDGVTSAVRSVADSARAGSNPYGTNGVTAQPETRPIEGSPAPAPISPEREYPTEGVDSYGAMPDTATVYEDALASSALAENALYMSGDANQPPLVAPPLATPTAEVP